MEQNCISICDVFFSYCQIICEAATVVQYNIIYDLVGENP